MFISNIISDIHIFENKQIKCDNGVHILTINLCGIKKEILKTLCNGYKFRYKNIRCILYYTKYHDKGIYLYAYINISILNDSLLEKLNLPNKITYNDKLWIGLFIDNLNDLSLDDIIYDDEKYLNQENNFKLPSYGIAKCRMIINNYLYYSKCV